MSSPEVEIVSGSLLVTLVYKRNGGVVRGAAENCASGGVVLVPSDLALLVVHRGDAKGAEKAIRIAKPAAVSLLPRPFPVNVMVSSEAKRFWCFSAFSSAFSAVKGKPTPQSDCPNRFSNCRR